MKNLLSYMFVGCLATLFLGACGSTSNVSVNVKAPANTAGNTTGRLTNTVSNAANTVANAVSGIAMTSPESFMKEAAQGGMAEVEISKLAASKATNPEVKKFAQMMVTDHTKANAELKGLAATKKVELPVDMGSHKSTMDDLSKTSAADFDKAYVDAMVEDHEDDVAAFEKQADKSADAELKAFAAKTLPTLKKHLEAIKAIQAKMK